MTTTLTTERIKELLAVIEGDLEITPEYVDDLVAAAEELAQVRDREIDNEMAAGALNAIHELLDSGGIPRGTFADDHVRNLVALYNQRGAALKSIAANTCCDKCQEAALVAKTQLDSEPALSPTDTKQER